MLTSQPSIEFSWSCITLTNVDLLSVVRECDVIRNDVLAKCLLTLSENEQGTPYAQVVDRVIDLEIKIHSGRVDLSYQCMANVPVFLTHTRRRR